MFGKNQLSPGTQLLLLAVIIVGIAILVLT
jgi:hypothetical protein